VSVSGFQVSLSISRFPFPRFQSPQCWHGRTEYWKLPAFLPNIQNVVTIFSCWQCLYTLLGPISLLYKQLLQYMLLKSFTVPSALLIKFSKKFQTKLLASAFIFTNLPTKTLCFDADMFQWSIKGLAMLNEARKIETRFKTEYSKSIFINRNSISHFLFFQPNTCKSPNK